MIYSTALLSRSISPARNNVPTYTAPRACYKGTRSRGRGGMAYAADLTYLECSPGNRRCRTAQIRGNLNWRSRAKPEAIFQEGVETRRAAPNLRSVLTP